jgi:hypothetical protein
VDDVIGPAAIHDSGAVFTAPGNGGWLRQLQAR